MSGLLADLASLSVSLRPEHINAPAPPLFLGGCCSEVGRACALSVLFFVEGKCGMARGSALGGYIGDLTGLLLKLSGIKKNNRCLCIVSINGTGPNPLFVGGTGQGVGVRVELALSALIKETVGLWRRGRL